MTAQYPKSRLLRGLNRAELGAILAAATRRCYPANSVVLNQGDPADDFLLLTAGHARLFYTTQEGQKVLLRWLMPGEILGGAALLNDPSNYLVSTEVVKESSALVWRRNTIRTLAVRYPALLENALSFASDHLTWFVASHMALISNTARERLANVLLSLTQGLGNKVSAGVRLDITNEELANAAHITLFTASRILSKWQRNGAILKERGRITLHAPDRLFQWQAPAN